MGAGPRDGTPAVAATPGGPAAFAPNPGGGPAGFVALLDRVLDFTFGAEAGGLVVDVEVPDEQVRVLDALEARAAERIRG